MLCQLRVKPSPSPFVQTIKMLPVRTVKCLVVRSKPLALVRSLSSQSASFQTKPFKLHKLDSGPSTDVTVTRDDAIRFYREMATIRRLEAAANSLYKEKAVRGFCHLYTGQEAVCVGMENAIT